MFWKVVRWGGSALVVAVTIFAVMIQMNTNSGSRGSSGGSHQQQENPAANRYRMN